MDAYARHGRALLRKAERILGRKADAQDLVHALFVDLLQRGEASPDLPYLYRAINNRCLTFLRDENNRARLLGEAEEILRGPVRTRCDDRAIDMDLFLKLTRTLDEPTLDVLICHHFDDMTQEEVASVLGTSRKTVGRRLEDIRQAVRKLTGEE